MVRLKYLLILLSVITILGVLPAMAARADKKLSGNQGQKPSGISPEIMPNPPWGYSPWGWGGDPSYVPGVTDRDSKMSALVRDIAVLRQINRINLTPAQIRKVLLPLRRLAKDQKELTDRAVEGLVKERSELLRGNGESTTQASQPLKIRDWFNDFRGGIDRAKKSITEVVPTSQAIAVNELIDPGSSFQSWPTPGSFTPPGSKKTSQSTTSNRPQFKPPSENVPRMTRPPMIRPLVEVSRLVELLEEKLEAMQPSK